MPKAGPTGTTPCWFSWPPRAASEWTATRRCANEIERQVGHINGTFGEIGHPVVHYLHRPVDRDELIAFFVAADVMLVTPLRDGMNLVAKEYVACRSDLGGALVLSEFTGAAEELRQAYLTNPHHHDGVKDSIAAALDPVTRGGTPPDAVAAPPGTGARCGPVGPGIPRCTGRNTKQSKLIRVR